MKLVVFSYQAEDAFHFLSIRVMANSVCIKQMKKQRNIINKAKENNVCTKPLLQARFFFSIFKQKKMVVTMSFSAVEIMRTIRILSHNKLLFVSYSPKNIKSFTFPCFKIKIYTNKACYSLQETR